MEMKHSSTQAEYNSVFMPHLRQIQYIWVSSLSGLAMTAGKVSYTGLTNGYYWDFFITAQQNKTILSL